MTVAAGTAAGFLVVMLLAGGTADCSNPPGRAGDGGIPGLMGALVRVGVVTVPVWTKSTAYGL